MTNQGEIDRYEFLMNSSAKYLSLSDGRKMTGPWRMVRSAYIFQGYMHEEEDVFVPINSVSLARY